MYKRSNLKENIVNYNILIEIFVKQSEKLNLIYDSMNENVRKKRKLAIFEKWEHIDKYCSNYCYNSIQQTILRH